MTKIWRLTAAIVVLCTPAKQSSDFGSVGGIGIGQSGLPGYETEAQKVWNVFIALGNIAFAYSYSMILIEIQVRPSTRCMIVQNCRRSTYFDMSQLLGSIGGILASSVWCLCCPFFPRLFPLGFTLLLGFGVSVFVFFHLERICFPPLYSPVDEGKTNSIRASQSTVELGGFNGRPVPDEFTGPVTYCDDQRRGW